MNAECVDRTLLVVSELVTNAVAHAQPPIALHLDKSGDDDTVHVAVEDGGTAEESDAWATSRGPGEHGRGKLIVDALCSTHGVCVSADRTTHWADVDAAV